MITRIAHSLCNLVEINVFEVAGTMFNDYFCCLFMKQTPLTHSKSATDSYLRAAIVRRRTAHLVLTLQKSSALATLHLHAAPTTHMLLISDVTAQKLNCFEEKII